MDEKCLTSQTMIAMIPMQRLHTTPNLSIVGNFFMIGLCLLQKSDGERLGEVTLLFEADDMYHAIQGL